MEPIRISQINYSLAHSSVETFGDNTLVCMDTKEFRWYKKHDFPVMAFSPQAKGFLQSLQRATLQTISLRDSMQVLLILQDLQR